MTAGNASGIGDGAAAMVISSAEWAGAQRREADRPPGLLGDGGGGAEVHGHRPGAGVARARSSRRGLSLEQMDLVEVNEAFGSQYCAVEKELGLDRERTNVSGGAIALSHPLGASGARITVHLLHELRRRGKRYGLGTACIGGGQGIAVVVEAMG